MTSEAERTRLPLLELHDLSPASTIRRSTVPNKRNIRYYVISPRTGDETFLSGGGQKWDCSIDFVPAAGRPRSSPSPLPPEPAAPPAFELTVEIDGEVSRMTVPVDLDRVFAPETERGPSRTAAECWVPADQFVEVGGRQIGGGLFYLGDGLRGADKSYIGEPALIDPSLAVGTGDASETGDLARLRDAEPRPSRRVPGLARGAAASARGRPDATLPLLLRT